jgi:predicted phosphodiesterase
MRFAIISDIHGNLEAFEQVLSDIDSTGITEVFNLGDNIGYGPDPDGVIQAVRRRNIPSVLGNHELAVNNPKYLRWFNPVARESLLKTIRLLSDQSIYYVSKQQAFLMAHGCRFVHGFPPKSALLYLFQISDSRKKKALEHMKENICFVGHTHLLELISYDGHHLQYESLKEGVFQLSHKDKYIINIGSVGQPRDGDNRAKYAIWDASRCTIEIKYISYDIGVVVEKIRAAGLPDEHGARLW